MFFYGENSNLRPVDDFRPEVHDSDGLQILTSTGEWIWRPLIDPRKLLVTSFQLKNPRGFGLFQRDRNFDHYQDLEADYQLRPSLWIIPKGNWETAGSNLWRFQRTVKRMTILFLIGFLKVHPNREARYPFPTGCNGVLLILSARIPVLLTPRELRRVTKKVLIECI